MQPEQIRPHPDENILQYAKIQPPCRADKKGSGHRAQCVEWKLMCRFYDMPVHTRLKIYL